MSEDSRRLRVLIVEDEPILAIDLEMTVEDCGHLVVGEAHCLKSAIALADDTDPHLAFVDVHLAHDTSGIDVSAMIQRRWPDAMIVFVTANRARVPEDLGGAHGIIIKPFTERGIVATLAFMTEGVFDPPPRSPPPTCLITAPKTAERWALCR